MIPPSQLLRAVPAFNVSAFWLACCISLLAHWAPAAIADEHPPAIDPEPLNQILKLPVPYPSHWILALDSSFFHMLEGQVVVLDPLATTLSEQYKGMYTAAGMATIGHSRKRGELYVAETFQSRAGRGGTRTDTFTIWDPATLSVSAEITIPPKRVGAMPKRIAMGSTNDDRFMLIYNFTPAQSVSVVDLDARKFVGEIDTAGCAFVIPTGKRGFSSICSNGSLLSVALDSDGSVSATSRTDAVIDIDTNPVFEAYGETRNTAYFPTFLGDVLPVKLSGSAARPLPGWPLVSEQERAAGWRPGGIIPIVNDNEGLLYVLMHSHGADGTHKDPGSQVWVFDAKKKKRLRVVELQTPGLSLGITGGNGRQILTVVNAELVIDIYDAATGNYLNAIQAALDTSFRVDGIN